MKTKNKIQKTVLKSLAIFASIVLVSFTASASNFWHLFIENENATLSALLIIDNPIESKSKKSKDLKSTVFHLETELESKLELEEWMTNNNLFQVQETPKERKVIKTSNFTYMEIKDPKLEFEEWMFNPNCWSVRNNHRL